MTTALGYITDCGTVPLHQAMMNTRVIEVVRDLEHVAQQYADGHPGIVIADNKLTRDNCVFVKVVCTFKFPL